MPRRSRRYPEDLQLQDIPAAALVAAREETWRFLCNYFVWQGDLHHLCAVCYLQGALDGAQVQQTLAQVETNVDDDDAPCPYCDEDACERSCTGALLHEKDET